MVVTNLYPWAQFDFFRSNNQRKSIQNNGAQDSANFSDVTCIWLSHTLTAAYFRPRPTAYTITNVTQMHRCPRTGQTMQKD